jgi:ribosomal protein L40E
VSRYIPQYVKDAVRDRDRGRCRQCGARSGRMHFDHITPYSKGGPATVNNIQLLCEGCNLKKSAKTKHCHDCGAWIPHESTFCRSCGKKINVRHEFKEAQGRGFGIASPGVIAKRLVFVGAIFLILVGLGFVRC